jgi:hypothetical protein
VVHVGHDAVYSRPEDGYRVDLHEAAATPAWTLQTTSAFFPTSSKMHWRSYVVWQKKPIRLHGLQTNTGKTKVMRINIKQQDPVQLHQENIKEVN